MQCNAVLCEKRQENKNKCLQLCYTTYLMGTKNKKKKERKPLIDLSFIDMANFKSNKTYLFFAMPIDILYCVQYQANNL